jgi:hypothetical protein
VLRVFWVSVVMCRELDILSDILGMVHDLTVYYNRYAFSQVAIYGKDFCTAGKVRTCWLLVTKYSSNKDNRILGFLYIPRVSLQL